MKIGKKAIILGAGGFIGINLTHFLVEKGYDVICFDRVPSCHWPKNVQVITGDFSILPEALLSVMENALVFHLITSSKPSALTINAPSDLVDVSNVLFYLEKTKYRNLKWIYLSSGGTVYGQSQGNDDLFETSTIKPICSYGIAKLSIEYYFSLYQTLYRTDYRIIRLANPYGPWQSPFGGQGLIATILYSALNNKKINIWGDGENIRDYIYISDALNAFLMIADSGQSGEIYNVGTGDGLSINQLINIIRGEVDIPIDIEYSEARTIDVKRNVLNINKIKKNIGWSPSISIYSGISMTRSWLETVE